MSTAVAEINATPMEPPRNPLAAGFSRLDNAQKLKLLGGLAALLAMVIAAIFMSRQPEIGRAHV